MISTEQWSGATSICDGIIFYSIADEEPLARIATKYTIKSSISCQTVKLEEMEKKAGNAEGDVSSLRWIYLFASIAHFAFAFCICIHFHSLHLDKTE